MKWKIALTFTLGLAGCTVMAAAGDFVAAREGAVKGRYIVMLEKDALRLSPDEGEILSKKVSGTAALAREVAVDNKVKVKEVWGAFGFFLVEANESAAKRLAGDPRVARVEQDAAMQASAIQNCFDDTHFSFPLANSYTPTSPQTISCWDPQLNCTDNWGLDRIDQRTGSQSAHTLDGKFYFTATGQGVHMYIVDTGLIPTHSEFALTGGGTRVGNGTNVSPDQASWDYTDGSGHGTLVASVAAGRRFGVAKGATIHPVRISNGNGATTLSLAISGLNWVVLNVQRPAVVNLSYNLRRWVQDTSTLDSAAQQMISTYGIPLVNSAGNWNRDATDFSPTIVPGVIVVAGLDWVNNQRWGADPVVGCHNDFCGSNWGPSVDLYAPAADILGALGSAESTYACIGTGTSFAAPLAAGVAAQYLQGNPTATPAQLETALINNATTGVIQGNLQFSPNRLLYTNY